MKTVLTSLGFGAALVLLAPAPAGAKPVSDLQSPVLHAQAPGGELQVAARTKRKPPKGKANTASPPASTDLNAPPPRMPKM